MKLRRFCPVLEKESALHLSGTEGELHGTLLDRSVLERFNRSYREAVLGMFVFQSLYEVREQTEKWLKEYNEERPQESLGHLTPREYLEPKSRKFLITRGCNCGTGTNKHLIKERMKSLRGASHLIKETRHPYWDSCKCAQSAHLCTR